MNDPGLPLAREMATALVLLAFLGCFATSPAAFAAETRLAVLATVPRHARLTVLLQPESIMITPAEIAQGYVDVPASIRLVVECNSRSGYVLVVDVRSEFVRQIRVRGLGNDFQIGEEGGEISRLAPGPGMGKATLELGVRLLLSPAARQGILAWPIQMSVAPR